MVKFDSLKARMLWRAAIDGDLDALRRGVESGEALSFKDSEGFSLLAHACRRGQAGSAALLIQAGCDLESVDELGHAGFTPAMNAAAWGRADCLALMIEAGCRLEARDRLGGTAAALAASEGHAGCLSMLMAAGCDIDSKDDLGCLPVAGAAAHGRSDCLSMLIQAGCDLGEDEGSVLLCSARKVGSERHAQCHAMILAEIERRSLLGCAAAPGAPRPGSIRV